MYTTTMNLAAAAVLPLLVLLVQAPTHVMPSPTRQLGARFDTFQADFGSLNLPAAADGPSISQPAGGSKHPAVVFGVLSSQATFKRKLVRHVLPWWTQGTTGAVYVDELLPEQLQKVPQGMAVVNQSNIMSTYAGGKQPANAFGFRGTVMFLDLYNRHPDADWFVGVDDDTYMVLPNLASELSKYDAAHPWYIGTPSTVWLKQHAWGSFAVGGAGLILSRGALARMARTLPGCALVWSQAPGDKSLSECVLAHGIPLTQHAGLHQSDCWSLQELIHHPAAPLLSLHKSHTRLSQPVKQALLVNPWGFAQQARCPVKVAGEPHVLHISSGVAATLWPAKGPHMQQHMLLMPAARADVDKCIPQRMKESKELQHLQPGAQHVTLPVAARRPPPLAHFNVSTTSAGCGQASAQVCKTYTLSKEPMPSKRHLKGSKPTINGSLVQEIHTILVQEPLWKDRWRQPATRLCCSHVDVTEGPTGKQMEVTLSNDPSQCIWEGF